MAHTYDIATDRGKVRLGLADTRQASAFFTDAEIDHLLDEGGTVDGAINEGLRVMVSAFTLKGDVERAAAARAALALRGGDMPTVVVGEGNSIPTDDAYVWP